MTDPVATDPSSFFSTGHPLYEVKANLFKGLSHPCLLYTSRCV